MNKLRYVFMVVASVLCLLTLSGCQWLVNAQAPAPITTVPSSTAGETKAEAVYHTVAAGDSLYKIAQRYGQKWENIAEWNNIANPSAISIGTVLLVVPGGDKAGAAVTGGSTSGEAATPGSGSIQPLPGADGLENRMLWDWPAKGSVVNRFDGVGNKGIDIAGKAGDPVYAAADGRVAYVGDGLQGYGNLVIIKHNDIFVTAYAHNRKILVQENQVVRRGDKVAEMGDTDASRVMLHFEIRQQSGGGSSAVDPMKYLPAR
ncbi:MAG: peptidoglycan DD-metalloendopeptidase family protein [Saezia sp.]